MSMKDFNVHLKKNQGQQHGKSIPDEGLNQKNCKSD